MPALGVYKDYIEVVNRGSFFVMGVAHPFFIGVAHLFFVRHAHPCDC